MRRWALVFGLLAACGHAAPPETMPAEDLPPLPPPSATGIGLLRDSAPQIGLRAEQTAKLEELDNQLADVNGPLEDQLDGIEHTTGPRQPHAARRRGGGRGMGGGGMGGGMGGGRHGGGGMQQPSQEEEKPNPTEEKERKQRADERAREAGELRQKIAANESDFLRQALELLDPDQRTRAEELLAKHGFRAHAP